MILSRRARRWDFKVSGREIAGAYASAVGRKPSMQELRRPVILEATHASTVEFVSLEDLMGHAADI